MCTLHSTSRHIDLSKPLVRDAEAEIARSRSGSEHPPIVEGLGCSVRNRKDFAPQHPVTITGVLGGNEKKEAFLSE